MRNILLLTFAAFLLFTSHKSRAMSFQPCSQHKWSDQEVRQYLAVKKYSPFRALFYESYVGNIGAIFYLSDRDSHLPNWASVTAPIFWSAGAIFALMMSSKCNPDDTAIQRLQTSVTRQDLSQEWLEGYRGGYLFFHTLNTIPTFIFASYSGQPQHWGVLAAAYLFPFLADATYRIFFDRDRVSPISLEPQFVQIEHDWEPIAALTYHW